MTVEQNNVNEFSVRGKKFELFEHTGEVMEVRSDDDGFQRMFIRYENGVEEEYNLSDAVGVRKGHKVTMFFLLKNGDDTGYIAGMKNHDTGKACYRDEVGERYFPSHWVEAMLHAAIGSLDNTNDMMAARSPLMGLIMLPVFIIMAAIGLAVFLIGFAFYGSSASARKKLKAPVQDYMHEKHGVAWAKKKKGVWYYTWRTALGCAALVLVLDVSEAVFNKSANSDVKTRIKWVKADTVEMPTFSLSDINLDK